MKTNNDLIHQMRTYSEKTVGPTMCLYVEWVLAEAHKRGFKRLYFLARDGYLLFEIAKKAIKKRGMDIECRYLYCSRQALRIPSYHLIGEEAFDLLTLGGYYLTPKSVISRAMISDETVNEILCELGISRPDEPFCENEFVGFSNKLRKNEKYRKAVADISLAAYEKTIDYFKQEGLFDNNYVAIVDSGWTGSMQRSLRQLMQNEGYTGKFYGFYFGMYTEPKSAEDGEYLTFYFDSKKGFWKKLFFNNNLFECMLSAPHPMTIGYMERNGNIAPVYTKGHADSLLPLIETQIEAALDYAEKYFTETCTGSSAQQALKNCYKILKRAMVYPTKEEVELLSNFMFCDDVTEGYRKSIADRAMLDKLSSYSFFPRLWRKLTGKKNSGANEIFWVYGVIAYCPRLSRSWHRLNVMMWDIVKATVKK